MNSTLYGEPIIEVHREDVVCWTTNWKDITKFLLFNFVLHAITVLSSPGDGVLLATSNKLICLCMPLCGMGKAITTIYRFSYGQTTPLQKALRAGALCRVLPDVSKPLPGHHNTPPKLVNVVELEDRDNIQRSAEGCLSVLYIFSGQSPCNGILCEHPPPGTDHPS